MIYFALVVALLWSVYPFLLRTIRADFMTIWVWMNGIATVVGIMLCWIMKKPLTLGSTKDVVYMTLASVLGPVCGALLYVWLLKRSDKTTPVVALAFTAPAIAALLGCFVFKEHSLSLVQVVGVVMVCMGVVLVAMREK